MIRYLPFFLIVAIMGIYIIGFGTNDLQSWYVHRHDDINLYTSIGYGISMLKENQVEVENLSTTRANISYSNLRYFIVFWIICYAQVVLIPVWIIFCVAVTGGIFYNRELKKPINLLLDSSRKIKDNQLDFEILYAKPNEIGMLCRAFEEMRLALYENNREMWRSLEERKRLNSAFSHDLRTPLTVLKGYTDFLEKYIPGGKITEEKLLSVLSMMNGQILRLEHYTQKMNTVQKLEDIVPNICSISREELFANLSETGKMICGDDFRLNGIPGPETISVDTELVMQVYENLISNAKRYAEKSVVADYSISEDILTISVLDDGKGFTEEALKNAAQPFFRDEKEPDKTHFGLGLYICRILCEKCGGTLTVENYENGGKVTARFFCGSISESR